MSVIFSPIYHFVNTTTITPEDLQRLEERVNEATQQEFLALANTYPYAFGSTDAPKTFQKAISSLSSTLQAMEETVFSEGDVQELSNKVARTSFYLLRAIHEKEQAYKDVEDTLIERSYSDGTPILTKALQEDTTLSTRVFLKTGRDVQRRLEGKGNFTAPAFLDQCSPDLMVLDLSSLWIKYVLPSIGLFRDMIELDLSNNLINTLPHAIGDLKSLRVLNLSKNKKLEKIPEQLGGCTALVKLLASETALSDLPGSLRTLTNLKVVDVRKTKFDPNASAVYVSLMRNGVDVEASPNPAQAGLEGLLQSMGGSEGDLSESLLRAVLGSLRS